MNYYVAGVAPVNLYDSNGLWAEAKTLTDTTMNVSLTLEEIRAGAGALLFGMYAHSAMMKMNFTEAMFRMEYIAKNVGSTIEIGGAVPQEETATVQTAGEVTLSKIPVEFATYGLVGDYKLQGTDAWQRGQITGSVMTIPNAEVGQKYCVKYHVYNESARNLSIKANFVPDTTYAEVLLPLFAGEAGATSTRAGTVVIKVPRLMFDGGFEIPMNMTGASTFSLSGTALAYTDGASCETGSEKLCELVEIIFDADYKDSVYALALEGGDIEIATGETKTLRVLGLIAGAQPKVIPNADLTFVSNATATATVTNAGVVTGVASGSTSIDITLTGKSVSATKDVTVS